VAIPKIEIGPLRRGQITLGAAAVASGHVGGGPCLVDEHEALRLQIDFAVEPAPALAQDVGAVLLDRVAGLFSS